MNVLVWMLFGILIGFIIHISDSQNKKQIRLALVAGGFGGMLGGMTASLLFGIVVSRVSFMAFVIAIAASIGLLYFVKLMLTKQHISRKEGYV